MDEKNPQKNISENIKTIHTYSSDMADAVRTNEASVIKIALAEQEKREREALYKQAEGSNIKKFLLLIGSIVLIGLAVGGVYYLMKKNNAVNAPVQNTTANIETLISYDDQAFLDMSNATSTIDTASIIQGELKKNGKSGGIKSLFLTHVVNAKPDLLPLSKFLSLLKLTAPSLLIRSLDDQYMTGAYQPTDGSVPAHLFFLFKTKDYSQSYAGLLGWEKTMLDDLFNLFNIDVSGNNSVLLEKPWKDVVINNVDARALYTDDNKAVLYYLFIDKDNFLITDNIDAIKEVSQRLLAKKIKPL